MINIKQEKVFRTKLRNGERLNESRYLYSEKEFDENGNLLLSRILDAGGVLIEKNIFRYNDNGQRLEHEYYVDESEWSEKSNSYYDVNGKLEKEIITFMDGSESETSFLYEKDNILSVITKDTDENETTESIQRKYDQNGKLLKEEKFEYGELVSSEENTYDESGNLIYRKSLDAENNSYFEETFNVSENKVMSYDKTYPNGRTEKYKNTYDDNGNVIQIDFEGEYKSKSLISYFKDQIAEEKEILENDTILFSIKRKFENDRPVEVQNFFNRMGQAPDVEYVLDYVYE